MVDESLVTMDDAKELIEIKRLKIQTEIIAKSEDLLRLRETRSSIIEKLKSTFTQHF